jgi:hypothetical protein
MRVRLVSRGLVAQLQSSKNVQDAWDLFTEEINLAAKDFIPCIKSGKTEKKKRNMWADEKALAKIKKKRAAFQRYLQTKDGIDYLAYTRARNQAKAACRKAVKDIEKRIAKEAKTKPKAFYAYAKAKLSVHEGIADLVDKDGNVITNDIGKADLLNSFFCSVFTKENTDVMPDFAQRIDGPGLTEITVDKNKVYKLLSTLDPSKAAGPDNMHPMLLKELAAAIAEPLTVIFELSLREGVLPTQWKTANVTPLFKKGERCKTNNYRPVSLTSVPCKILEQILRDNIFGFLDENKLLSPCQHGFVSKRSCVTNLLSVLDNWTSCLDDGIPVDVMYLDFSKAFDCVAHERLLTKLESYGIRGKVKNWIRDFLVGRRQRVKVNGSFSGWADVSSGVPQGSVLGPVLFVLFINDLPDLVRNLCSMYADDTKVYGPAASPEHCESLQRDLDSLVSWADDWQMKFNADKCQVLRIGSNNMMHQYTMRVHGTDERVQLESVNSERDLGVIIDSELKFSTHVESQVNKANRILGLIRRSYEHLDCESMRLLYVALIRPHLEFANCAWNPRLEKDKKLVEGVLKRATKCIPGLGRLEYEERLKVLKLPSMCYRRIRGDLIEMYKFSHGYYNCDKPFEFSELSTTRGHDFKVKKHFCRTGVRQHFFGNRIVDTWNALDSATVKAETLNSFKNRIDWIFKDYIHCSDIKLPLKPQKPNQPPAEANEKVTTSIGHDQKIV